MAHLKPRVLMLLPLLLLISLQPGFGQAPPKVSKIEVVGSISADESMVLFLSGLHEGMALSGDMHEIADAIRSLYNVSMFSDVRIDGAPDEGGNLKLRIRLEEFPKLDKLVLQGNKNIKKDKIEKAVGFLPGQFVSPRDRQRARNQILDLYKKENYLLTKVSMNLGEATVKGRQPLVVKIDEGPPVKLQRIRFSGNEHIPDGRLRKQMKKTKPKGFLRGGDFNEDDYRADLKKVLECFRKNGFREASIVSDSVYYDDSKRNLFIDIAVEEGRLFQFGKITWSGNQTFDDKRIATLVSAGEGQT